MGSGVGDGDGTGSGSGTGSGAGTGSGNRTGTGSGMGSGSGCGTGDGDGTGSGSGTGSGAGNESGNIAGTGSETGMDALVNLSEEELFELLENLFGSSFEDMEAEGKIVAATVMNRIGQAGSSAASGLAQQLIQTCVTERNRYAYTKLSGSGQEYILISTLGKVTGYRYVYSDSLQEAILNAGSKTYHFYVGKTELLLPSGKTAQMDAAVKLSENLAYLPENAAKTYFECEAEYIDGSEYAACLTNSMKTQAESILEDMKSQG